MGTAIKMMFLSVSSLGYCMCPCAMLIAPHGLHHCILILIALRDKNYYSHFTYQETEPRAVENFVQGHVVCKGHAVT